MSATLSVSPAPPPPAAQAASAGAAATGEQTGGFGGVLARLADAAGAETASSPADRTVRKSAGKDPGAGAGDTAIDPPADDPGVIPGGMMIIPPPATPQPQAAAPPGDGETDSGAAAAPAPLPPLDPKLLLSAPNAGPATPGFAALATAAAGQDAGKAQTPPPADAARPLASILPQATTDADAAEAPAIATSEPLPVVLATLAGGTKAESTPAAARSIPAPALSETPSPSGTAPTGKGETVLPSAAQTAAAGNGAGGGDLSDQGGDAPSDGNKALAPKVETAANTGVDAAGQQAVAGPATAAAHSPSSAPAATPQTIAHLAAQIVAKAGSAKATQFEVALDPQGLGRVNVSLRIAADGTMSAAMSFDTPQAAAELRARSDELQRALTQAGFNVADGALTFDVADDSSRQGRGQNARSLFDFAGGLAGLGLPADAPPTGPQLIAAYRASQAGGVDIRI